MAAPRAAQARSTAPTLFSIGQVLAKLTPEFPDLSPSKLRFLEAERLVAPARTEVGVPEVLARRHRAPPLRADDAAGSLPAAQGHPRPARGLRHRSRGEARTAGADLRLDPRRRAPLHPCGPPAGGGRDPRRCSRTPSPIRSCRPPIRTATTRSRYSARSSSCSGSASSRVTSVGSGRRRSAKWDSSTARSRRCAADPAPVRARARRSSAGRSRRDSSSSARRSSAARWIVSTSRPSGSWRASREGIVEVDTPYAVRGAMERRPRISVAGAKGSSES